MLLSTAIQEEGVVQEIPSEKATERLDACAIATQKIQLQLFYYSF